VGKQSNIVQTVEGDAWHARNKSADRSSDPVLHQIFTNPNINPTTVLEIGCGTGWRLARIMDRYYGADCRGCDLSWEAIEAGRNRYKRLGLRVASADSIGYPNDSFDLVILGFFMYLVDREDLFRVVAEVDRVLRDKGFLVIHDFLPDEPHSRDYAHDPRLSTYKMGYHQLFMANPSYQFEAAHAWGGGDDREAIHILRKDHSAGWPRRA